jgi:hypothetical protein
LAVAVWTAFSSPRLFFHFNIVALQQSIFGSFSQFEIRKENSRKLGYFHSAAWNRSADNPGVEQPPKDLLKC